MKPSFESQSENETLQWAQKWGRQLEAGVCVAVTGNLGSGKTVFIKGVCRGLGVKDPDRVKSPTFVLFHLYEGRVPIYHFDLYRLDQKEDLGTIGFDEFVQDPHAVSLVEWADRAPHWIPAGAVWTSLEISGPHSRKISVRSWR